MLDKRTLIGLTVAAFLSVTSIAPRAEACGEGMGEAFKILYLGASALTVNTSFTIHDLVVDRSSLGYAFFETLLTVPQTTFGASMLADTVRDGGGNHTFMSLLLGYTLWSGALAAHGIYVIGSRIAKSESKGQQQMQPGDQYGSPRMSITPTVVDDGMHKGMGLGLVGSF